MPKTILPQVINRADKSVKASAYYAGKFKNPEDGRKAIAADREFLRLCPPNPDSIRIAQGEIKEIQEKLDATAK